jgi:triosephosphate isomerase
MNFYSLGKRGARAKIADQVNLILSSSKTPYIHKLQDFKQGFQSMRPLIAGNWKMHGLLEDRKEITALAEMVKQNGKPDCDIVLCLPFTLLFPAVKYLADTPITLGAQDCHWDEFGAHTGDVSAAMIRETECDYVIVGHSERRSGHGAHGERSQVISQKAKVALAHDMMPIICIGESLDEREAGKAKSQVLDQLKKSLPGEVPADRVLIAYEPIWAIGTGLTASAAEIGEMHDVIRQALVEELGGQGEKVRILYGGSVKPGNAAEILGIKNVNGALVGGASLKAEDFYGIIKAAG